MSYKLLALDIDGTLLNSQSELTDSTIAAIQLAIKNGLKVCLVSGRRPKGMVHYAQAIGLTHPLVAYNGAVIADPLTLEPIQATTIPLSSLKELFAEYDKLNMCTCVYRSSATPPDIYYAHDAKWAYTQDYLSYEHSRGNALRVQELSMDISFNPLRIMVADNGVESRLAMEIAQRHLDAKITKYYYTQSYQGAWHFEVYPAAASKARGLQFLCEHFSCSPSEVVAVGDHVNDLDMIEFAGLGVAMGNAQPEVKDCADLTIGHHDKDGLAAFIKERLL